MDDLERVPFPDSSAARGVLRWLIAQDGSTTRACEAILDAPVSVRVHVQRAVDDVPPGVTAVVPAPLLERVTTLHAGSRVAMDNLVFVPLATAPEDFLRGVRAGDAPLGRLLAGRFLRRMPVGDAALHAALARRLEGVTGARAARGTSRTYVIEAPDGPLALVHEAYWGALALAVEGGAARPG